MAVKFNFIEEIEGGGDFGDREPQEAVTTGRNENLEILKSSFTG